MMPQQTQFHIPRVIGQEELEEYLALKEDYEWRKRRCEQERQVEPTPGRPVPDDSPRPCLSGRIDGTRTGGVLEAVPDRPMCYGIVPLVDHSLVHHHP